VEYWIGSLLALACVGLAHASGLLCQRAFYPMLMMPIATYYVLFAAMGGQARTVWLESLLATVFVSLAVLGFKTRLWLVVAALVGHLLLQLYSHRRTWAR
jgi:hypothetical protein